jgi:hypothetical protein
VSKTPVTYTADEAGVIREAVTCGETPTCPRCRETLIMLPAVMFGTKQVQEVFCPVCRHCVMVHDLTRASQPRPPSESRR